VRERLVIDKHGAGFWNRQGGFPEGPAQREGPVEYVMGHG